MRLALILAFWGLMGAACASESAQRATTREKSVARVRYPRAAWRVDPSSLNDVAFHLQRIVIAHESPQPTRYEFSELAPRSRTREQALRLARQVSAAAQARPDEFAELVARYSDDLPGRVWGGALGVLRATMIAPEIVDAFAEVDEGAVSQPIETAVGFQIVRRLPPPPLRLVRGQAIVLRHADVKFPLETPSSKPKWRQGELAERLYGELAFGASFDALRSAYSEDADVRIDPRWIVSSTHGANLSALATHVLAGLAVGQVSAPVDTAYGIVLLRRLPDLCPAQLARSEILITHRETLPASQRSERTRTEAEALARRIARQGSDTPESFRALQRSHCDGRVCSEAVITWQVGERELDAKVQSMRVGEVLSVPFASPQGFHVIRREPDPPEDSSTEDIQFSLPTPRARTYADLLVDAPGPYIATFTDREGRAFAEKQHFGPQTGERFVTFLESFASELAAASPPERGPMMGEASRRLSKIVGVRGAQDFLAFLDQRLELLQRNLGE